MFSSKYHLTRTIFNAYSVVNRRGVFTQGGRRLKTYGFNQRQPWAVILNAYSVLKAPSHFISADGTSFSKRTRKELSRSYSLKKTLKAFHITAYGSPSMLCMRVNHRSRCHHQPINAVGVEQKIYLTTTRNQFRLPTFSTLS